MIAICTFKTKIGYKIFVTLIGSNKSINTKYSDPGLIFWMTLPWIIGWTY